MHRLRGLRLVIVLLSGFGLTTAGSAAQELDVVSVRASEERESLPRFAFRPGRMEVANWRLRDLVPFAFGTVREQIEGWPDRDLPERPFTLTATYSGANTPPLVVQRRIVREILEDRFGMRTHIEQREQPIYALRLIEPGVLGPEIVEVDYDWTDSETRARRGDLDCRQGAHFDAQGLLDRGSGPLDRLVAVLQLRLRDRVVVDQTGLSGFYQWEMRPMEPGQAGQDLGFSMPTPN